MQNPAAPLLGAAATRSGGRSGTRQSHWRSRPCPTRSRLPAALRAFPVQIGSDDVTAYDRLVPDQGCREAAHSSGRDRRPRPAHLARPGAIDRRGTAGAPDRLRVRQAPPRPAAGARREKGRYRLFEPMPTLCDAILHRPPVRVSTARLFPKGLLKKGLPLRFGRSNFRHAARVLGLVVPAFLSSVSVKKIQMRDLLEQSGIRVSA
jgi:hypothetical protein